MEKIDLHNYEAFLLDYLEGNLDEAGRAELKLFALTHPELEIDLDNFDLPVFDAEDLAFDAKDQLKKTDADLLQNDALLRYIEGDLNEAERQELELKLLTDKALSAELAGYKKTILQADASETFTGKSGLLKTEDDLLLSNTLIAYYENQLPEAGRKAFELELAGNEGLAKELALLATTRLVADTSVVYPNKAELKKSARVIALFSARSLSAMAAAVLLLVALSFVFAYYTNQETAEAGLAKHQVQQQSKKHKAPAGSPPSHSATPQPQEDVLLANRLEAPSAKSISTAAATANKKQSAPPVPHREPATDLAEQQQKAPAPDVLPEKEEAMPEPALANNGKVTDKQDVSLVMVAAGNSPFDQTRSLAVIEEVYEDDAEPAVAPKRGFWQKAVKVARQINHLGLKAVDGEEVGGKNYSLSFNSFSVEKH